MEARLSAIPEIFRCTRMAMTETAMALAVFVKTPGYSPLKTRLADTVGQKVAEEFHRLSAMAVASVVGQASSSLNIHPYWAVAETEAMNDPLWRGFSTVSQGEGGLGIRLGRVYNLLRHRHRSVIFLGADSPQITPDHILQAFAALEAGLPATVLGPCIDGGFYLCGGNLHLDLPVWCDVAYGTNRAARQWCANVACKAPVTMLKTLFDVDRFEDLLRVKATLADGSRHLTPAQNDLLAWLEESGGGPGDVFGSQVHPTSVETYE
jgi:uncharacterized protein